MRNAIDNGASRNDAHIDFHFCRRARRVRDGGSATRSSAAIRADHDRARSISSAHLIWDIVNTGYQNTGYQPVTLTKLIVHAGNGANDDTLPLGLPETLCYHERIRVASDADWALLSARSIVAVDDAGIEYRAPDRQLDVVQDHLRQLIDRRVSGRGSPRDFLFGVLGLGFFMLMWVIGTD